MIRLWDFNESGERVAGTATDGCFGTSRYWGDNASEACRYANVASVSFRKEYLEWTDPSHKCDDGYVYTSPVGTHLPNRFGLFDMLGNVGELVEDDWNDNYTDAPVNGRTWIEDDCEKSLKTSQPLRKFLKIDADCHGVENLAFCT